jgi:hypothetical protein
MAAFVVLFSACQGWDGRRTDAAAGTSARLAVLSCRRFYGYWSVIAGRRFHLPAAKSTRFDDFRLKSRPALITEELQSRVPLEFDWRGSTKDG